jgi:hypothetical protein
MRRQMLLAPVPWQHLESAETIPALNVRVASPSLPARRNLRGNDAGPSFSP